MIDNMIFLRLIRISESKWGTFGVLKINEEPFCVTLEPPEMLNAVGKSQIPPSQYFMEKKRSPKYGMVWNVLDVPERTHILVHAGNVVDHTKGCIILASYFGKLKGDRAVLNSGKTFKDFMKITNSSPQMHLTITEVL